MASLRIQSIKKHTFLLYVGLPTFAAGIFYGFVASPMFVSDGSLVVYKASHRVPGIVAMLSGSAGGGSLEGGYVLKNYVASWSEFQKADKKINLAKNWSKGDFVFKYGGLWDLYQKNDLTLWRYYQEHVQVSVNTSSGIVSVNVLGPTAEFASRLGTLILADSVAHIDVMNRQEEIDYMARAVSQREDTVRKLNAVERSLAAYRSKIGIYDPKALYVSQLGYLENLKEEVVKVEAQYDTLASATPNNPVGRNLQAAIRVLRTKVNRAQASFSKLSHDAAKYDPFIVSESNEVSLLRQVNVAVQEAELNGEKNKYYLDVISKMSNPHTPELPHGIIDTFYVFLLSFVFWIFAR